ncbi:hypothetical protein CVT26_003479 [Gymnopilus dilepis]|uniref:Uncharacterized protein n=1 Tax=Gymnopilus dilepis TaxID=231916 RepID=A0A409W2Y4_9AGAR|nr:hypothetical protein CVT26_003479 [Gymnopilus dilepis]
MSLSPRNSVSLGAQEAQRHFLPTPLPAGLDKPLPRVMIRTCGWRVQHRSVDLTAPRLELKDEKIIRVYLYRRSSKDTTGVIRRPRKDYIRHGGSSSDGEQIPGDSRPGLLNLFAPQAYMRTFVRLLMYKVFERLELLKNVAVDIFKTQTPGLPQATLAWLDTVLKAIAPRLRYEIRAEGLHVIVKDDNEIGQHTRYAVPRRDFGCRLIMKKRIQSPLDAQWRFENQQRKGGSTDIKLPVFSWLRNQLPKVEFQGLDSYYKVATSNHVADELDKGWHFNLCSECETTMLNFSHL